MLPTFNHEGMLPPGDYPLTIGELLKSSLVVGDSATSPNWDADWRRELVLNLELMVAQLWRVGIREIFVDGSFAEDKDRPNDIDGYFECELMRLASGELERELNLLDPYKVWTWDPASRRSSPGSPKRQLPMWHTSELNSILTLDSRQAFVINLEMNWNFQPHLDILVEMDLRRGLLK